MRPQKRYDDTELIMYNLSDHGYDSPEGKQALRRMNNMHNRYDISNDDFLYVLSTFVFEPFRWVEKYGRRPLTDKEKEAAFIYYQNVGRRMNIKDIPDDLDEFEAFNRAYEAEHFVYSDDNRETGESTIKLFLGFYLPKFLWPLGRPVIYSMMEPDLLDAFGFPHPPNWLRRVTDSGLRVRAYLLRYLPERKTPVLGSKRFQPTYPEGYNINELGTFKE